VGVVVVVVVVIVVKFMTIRHVEGVGLCLAKG
jgi:hypothetical protein